MESNLNKSVYVYKYVYLYKSESLCSTPKINSLVNQLQFNFFKKSQHNKLFWAKIEKTNHKSVGSMCNSYIISSIYGAHC